MGASPPQRPLPWLAILVGLLVFGALAWQVAAQGALLRVDEQVTAWVVAHRTPAWTALMRFAADAHETARLLALVLVAAAWRAWRRDWHAVRLLAVVPTGMLLNVGLKHLFQRARPVLDEPLVSLATYSFPSGHAVASTVFYGVLCAFVFRHVRSRMLRAAALVLACALVLLVCATRVYLGAHFLTDVVAGVIVGALVLCGFLSWGRGRLQPA